MATRSNAKLGYILMGIVAVVVVIALVNMNNEPSTQLGRATEELSEGVEDAGRELDPNRSAGERVGDAIEDMGENIQDATEN